MWLLARQLLAALLLAIPALPASAAMENFRATFLAPDRISDGGAQITLVLEHITGNGLGPSGWILGVASENAQVTAITIDGTTAADYLNTTVDPLDPDFVPNRVLFGFPNNRVGVATDVELDFFAATYMPEDTTNSVAILTVVPSTSDPRTPILLRFEDDLTFDPPMPPAPSFPNPFFQRVFNDITLAIPIPDFGGLRRRPGNRVPNGEFDLGIASWTASNATIAASDVDIDAFGGRMSGALKVDTQVPTTGAMVSQCLGVVGGADYVVGGSILSLSLAMFGTPGIDVVWYDDTTCTSPAATPSLIDVPVNLVAFEDVSADLTAPSNARTAQLHCRVDTTGGFGGDFEALCDSMLFAPEPGSGAAGAVALASLAGAAAARRRSRPAGSHDTPAAGPDQEV